MKISYRNTKKVDIFSSLLMTKHAEIKILPLLYWIPSTVLMLSPHVLMLSPNVLKTLHSTEAIPPLYWCYPPTVLNNLHSTEGIPPQYWSYPPHVLLLSPNSTEGIPPQYWIPSTVLMLSPTVLMLSPCMYWCIPLLYWTTSTVLKLSPHSTEAIPHCTEQSPQYWSYPPQYWSYPPTVLMLSPQCTEQPPMYWTTSNVLNNLHSTEPTLYGVKIYAPFHKLLLHNLNRSKSIVALQKLFHFRNVHTVLAGSIWIS